VTEMISRMGDRMLAAVLPKSTAAACLKQPPFKTCSTPTHCDGLGSSYKTYLQCQVNCAGQRTCHKIGCC
jgi:hypothetical protein